MVTKERRFDLFNNYDVVQARQCAREMARDLGFSLTDQTRIATAVSELARQTLSGQGKGEVRFATVITGARRGLECTCLGGDWQEAPRGTILGGVERLMDDFKLESHNEEGMAVVMRKWLKEIA